MALELYCATGNAHKLREFQQAAGDGVAIQGFGPLPCPETGSTFEENALQKAFCYSRELGKTASQAQLLFADDSGLEVDALGGAPGVRSARFAGENANDCDNNRLLLEKLRNVPKQRRTARFVCVIALVWGERELGRFRGVVEGRILERERGAGGFGYDPLFYYPPAERAFAELKPADKWRRSHRGQAYRQMLDWLRANA